MRLYMIKSLGWFILTFMLHKPIDNRIPGIHHQPLPVVTDTSKHWFDKQTNENSKRKAEKYQLDDAASYVELTKKNLKQSEKWTIKDSESSEEETKLDQWELGHPRPEKKIVWNSAWLLNGAEVNEEAELRSLNESGSDSDVEEDILATSSMNLLKEEPHETHSISQENESESESETEAILNTNEHEVTPGFSSVAFSELSENENEDTEEEFMTSLLHITQTSNHFIEPTPFDPNEIHEETEVEDDLRTFFQLTPRQLPKDLPEEALETLKAWSVPTVTIIREVVTITSPGPYPIRTPGGNTEGTEVSKVEMEGEEQDDQEEERGSIVQQSADEGTKETTERESARRGGTIRRIIREANEEELPNDYVNQEDQDRNLEGEEMEDDDEWDEGLEEFSQDNEESGSSRESDRTFNNLMRESCTIVVWIGLMVVPWIML